MTVISVINPKGGAGKSTLATHIAGYIASLGQEVMLGDVDRQQSSRLWLNLRPASVPKIHGWSINESNFARPPAGVRHIVLDTPGGFHGFSLMKVTMSSDAIVIPAGAAIFDRQAAVEALRELRTLPRVATGKCRIGCIGMRVDGRTRNAAAIEEWANKQAIAHLGTIRQAQAYVKCMESGISLFDLPVEKVSAYLGDWQQLTDWIDAIMATAPAIPGSTMQKPVTAPQPDILHQMPRVPAAQQRA